jgi:hypothetical protein
MAKKTVSQEQLCELLLKEVRDVSGLESVSSIQIRALADSERENGANWSLTTFDPGLAERVIVEDALSHIGLYMQREYSVEEQQFSGL